MINEILAIEMPKWLSGDKFEFCLEDILTDSLYYPSCGSDGAPVKFLSGNIYSFVYVDYGISEDAFLAEIKQENAFLGHEIIYMEKITKYALDRGQYIRHLPKISHRDLPSDWVKPPYCYWVVFERKDISNDFHPRRFSFLYLCSEGVSTYYTLYVHNKISPKILCIIQDGYGFGGNWTCFRNRKADLAQAVFYGKNTPEYLINGGYGMDGFEKPIWPEYTKPLYYNIINRCFKLWGKTE